MIAIRAAAGFHEPLGFVPRQSVSQSVIESVKLVIESVSQLASNRVSQSVSH